MKFRLVAAVAAASALLLSACSAPDNSSVITEPTVSSTVTNSGGVDNSDELAADLPEVLHRMQDGTIITVTDVLAAGEYVIVRVAAFNDQSIATSPSAYFDLVDEDGRRTPNSHYSAVNIAPRTSAEFNLVFRPEANSTPKSIAFGYKVTAINNEISLSQQDMDSATTAMEALRANYAAPEWPKANSFEVDGLTFTVNSVKRCSLGEGIALDDGSTERYFFDQKISCLRVDMTIENESSSAEAIDPLLMFSIYDANRLAGLSTDTYDGPMLWTTLNSGQKIRGDVIFVTTESGPITLLSKVGASMDGITIEGP